MTDNIQPGSQIIYRRGDDEWEATVGSIEYTPATPAVYAEPGRWQRIIRSLTPRRWRKPLPIIRDARPVSIQIITEGPSHADYRAAMADLIALADRFTALVNAPEIVGAVCGIDLENRRDAREERGRMTADVAEAFKKTRDEEQP